MPSAWRGYIQRADAHSQQVFTRTIGYLIRDRRSDAFIIRVYGSRPRTLHMTIAPRLSPASMDTQPASTPISPIEIMGDIAFTTLIDDASTSELIVRVTE